MSFVRSHGKIMRYEHVNLPCYSAKAVGQGSKPALAGTMVHSAMAAFKIPAILGGRLQSRLTIVNAPDFDKVGMDGLIANQVEEFLARHIDSISGVCCLVEGNKDTPEAYKDAFNAVLKQLGQGIAELTILCIMSGEGSEVDEKRLQKIQNSMRKAGVLYRRAAYFKCPELHEIESAAASLAWQSISDNFAEFFTSLSGNFTLKQKVPQFVSGVCSHCKLYCFGLSAGLVALRIKVRTYSFFTCFLDHC